MPLSRLSSSDIALYAQRSGLVASLSGSTVWRWLHEDAIRPWQHRCWIFPRDPHFQCKAERILELYERRWEGNGFPNLEAVAERLGRFERYFENIGRPFEWKFNRADLKKLIARMRARHWEREHMKMAA